MAPHFSSAHDSSSNLAKSRYPRGGGSGGTRTVTARSVEDETRNAELNGNHNPECWGDFSQLVKMENIKYLGTSPCPPH